MYQKSEEERNGIYWEMEYYRGKVEWAQGEINNYSPQQTRLREAIEKLSGYKGSMCERRNATKNLPFCANKWKGTTAEKYFNDCVEGGKLYGEYSACILAIEARISQIQSELDWIDSYMSSVNGVLNENTPLYNDASYRYNNYWWM